MKIPQVWRAPAFPVPNHLDLYRISVDGRRLFELTVWHKVRDFDWLDNPAYRLLRDELEERFK